ncbi:hypothetical protein C453_08618 [Haloferax elongans ATCC BAA-1513]|uniref:Uncharacterized protein n=1 Tax=Haloferax elongans ATCC BAA-1513 TaxID=1230453 RepID=M0HMP9_HALEO|nr:hypothetical protein C453_08618 [Haloferax elongans ATCC BAA-1513]
MFVPGTVSPVAVFVPAIVFGGIGLFVFETLGAGIGVVLGVALGVLMSRSEGPRENAG